MIGSLIISSWIGFRLEKRLKLTVTSSPYQLHDVNIGGNGSSGPAEHIQPAPTPPSASQTPTHAQQQRPSSPQRHQQMVPHMSASSHTKGDVPSNTQERQAVAPLNTPVQLSPMGLTVASPPAVLITSPSAGRQTPTSPSPNNNLVRPSRSPIANQSIYINGTNYITTGQALRRRILLFLLGSLVCSVIWILSMVLAVIWLTGGHFYDQWGSYLWFRLWEAAWNALLVYILIQFFLCSQLLLMVGVLCG
jgi:hypothetical protein